MNIINKIKLKLFGNPWTVGLVKILRYVGGGVLFYFVSKSSYLFPDGTDFFDSLKQTLNWPESTLELFLSFFWVLVLVVLFLAIYFYLSGILVEWLTRIELSPHQQFQILSQKTFTLGKESYSANLDQLEIINYSSSPHTVLKGKFTFHNKQTKGKVNFISYSHANVLKPYLTPANLESNLSTTQINFRKKTLFEWQKILLVIILWGGVLFFRRFKEQAESLPKNYKLGDIMKGQASKRAQAIEQDKRQKEDKEKKLKQARITPHQSIKITWDSIGGLRDAKRICRQNAEAILEENELLIEGKGRKPLREAQHILLYGPPGTGKTLLAQAMAKHAKGFFLNLNGKDFSTSFKDVFSGKAEDTVSKIKSIFDIAVSEAGGRTIIALVDEIDYMDNPGELLSILSGAEDEKYKNIILVATTNNKDHLPAALLRPGRLSKKQLINYPNEKELLEIIKKVLEDYHQKKNKDHPQAFNNNGQTEFVKRFADKIHKLMTQTKYVITYKEIGIKAKNIDPNSGRVLFTGADVGRIIFKEAPLYMGDRMTLKIEDYEKAIDRMYKDNRSTKGMWWGEKGPRQYIRDEIDIERDQDDDRPKDEPNRKLPEDF